MVKYRTKNLMFIEYKLSPILLIPSNLTLSMKILHYNYKGKKFSCMCLFFIFYDE